jgi:hypothetical protein
MASGEDLQYMQVIQLELQAQQQVVGRNMINNSDKINILNGMISNINHHISFLSLDIEENPDLDVPGKRMREDVLTDFLNQKMVLEQEINGLTAN